MLAEKFDLAVAVVDVHANISQQSSAAQVIIAKHPALLKSSTRIGLHSPQQSNLFRMALRYVVSGQPCQTLRADDGCMGAPLALQVSSWPMAKHCLVSLQPLVPQRADLSYLSNPFDLSNRQLQLLELFSEGLTLAEIAASLGLKPQTVREVFSDLYSRFELRNQLELLSALKSPTMATKEKIPDELEAASLLS
ncbi:helix-turn-helix transcriptional regulator [Algirhabdus cladophorae]|uniref:helix-turn-helix transcriptional regulator n=1 Tax=Algirhabdus cladophorae TaxID=3377108 RepID=UPI003B849B21